MKGALAVIRSLEAHGVDTVFGYPGGAIMPVYDALLETNLRHILTRHEQAAALGAIGYARVSKKPGVCIATSGPGATNLVTGIADAFLDSVPLVAITGQVASPFIGTDAFQEVDMLGITMPIVKHSFLVRSSQDICQAFNEAFRLATTGRPGPVLIDLPKDIANGECEFVGPDRADVRDRDPTVPNDMIDRARELITNSQRPIIYSGGGVISSDATEQFRAFVNATEIPTVHTLKGIGSLPADHGAYLGMLGMHGLKCANLAVQESDLLIVVGARFDDRVTGKLAEFAPHAKVIHLDIDPSEVGKLRRADVTIIGDLKHALPRLHVRLEIDSWRAHCAFLRAKHAWNYDAPTEQVYAPRMIRDLSLAAAGRDVYVSCDVGQHQMWVAQHYRFEHPRQQLTSGGLGTMGFGLPAAIGAQLASPSSTVINITGDGSIMMNIQELATIKRYGLPIKIVLFDNQALGMVRQWQELFNAKRYSQVDLSDNPNFGQIARAFEIPAIKVRRDRDVPDAIDRILNQPGPLFVHVPIDTAANVWPLVPPGASNTNMMTESVA